MSAEKTAWGFASVFGAVALGTGVAWGINAKRERECDAQNVGFDRLRCIDPAVGAELTKRAFIAAGVLTVATVTTAGVVHYRRKR